MLELFSRAGWVAYPLGFCSVLALGIVLERFYTLRRLRQAETEAFQALQKPGDGTLLDPALAAIAPVARVTDALRPLRAVGADGETLRHAASVALSLERLRLRRYLGTLATIGSTAPFIGLFGTVLGVMNAFQGMSRTGMSGETMAAGISEALSATAVGLLVAVPAVIAYNYFLGRAQAFLLEVEAHVMEVALAPSAAVSEVH